MDENCDTGEYGQAVSVKITEATILNPDEPTALQDYAYSYRTISL